MTTEILTDEQMGLPARQSQPSPMPRTKNEIVGDILTDAATAEAARDEARRKAQVANAMSNGRDALARHRGLQEAAAADPALISVVLGNPGLGARARLQAFKEWAAASGHDVSALNITMSHATKAWARINRDAGRK